VDDLEVKTGYWKFEEEVLDCTLCGIRFGKDYGSVVRKTME
jgi:hypothetical protein